MKLIHSFVLVGALISANCAAGQETAFTVQPLPPISKPSVQLPAINTLPRQDQPVVRGVVSSSVMPNTFQVAGSTQPVPTAQRPSPVIATMAASTSEPATLPPGQPTLESIPPGTPAQQVPRAFSLAELEGIAMGNNPTLGQASARVQAARATYVQVGLYPNPTVGYQGVEIGNEGRAGQQGVYLGQELVLGKKLQLNQNAAAQAVRQAEQEFQAQRLRVMNDVRTGFYDTLVAQRKMEIITQLQGIAEEGLGIATKLLKPPAAEGTQVDILNAEIELGNVRIAGANASNAYLSSWRRLAATIGVPNMSPIPLVGDLEANVCDLTWEQSVHQVFANSPELAAARAGVEQAKWSLSRARAEPIPNIDVQLTMQHDNASTSDIAGVQAVLPVPLFNRNQGGIGRAQSELTVANREVERLQLGLQQRLAVAFERYSNSKRQVDIYRNEILPKSKKSLDMVILGYRQTEFTYLMVLNAQRTYFQTNLAYLDAQRELRETSISIQGLLLTDSLGVGPAPVTSPPSYPRWDASPVIPGMGR